MKYSYIIIFIIVILLIYLYFNVKNKRNKINNIRLLKNNLWTIVPASKHQATIIFKKLINTNYVNNFSNYDLMSKTHNENNNNKKEYINYSLQQILEWTREEKIILIKYYNKLIDRLIELNIIHKWKNMPNTVNIIKSTMNHEGNAQGYTIKNNIIMKHLDYSLFVHEMFHVFSRYNPKLSEDLYKIFKIWVADEIILPNNNIKNMLISNPDTPQIVFTEINYKGKQELVTPILHSNKKYNKYSKSFFDDMDVSLMFVEVRVYLGKVIIIFKQDKKDINYMIPIKDSPEYLKKLGNNTDYNIHPEEVSARHFEFLIEDSWKTKKNPELIEKMLNLLR